MNTKPEQASTTEKTRQGGTAPSHARARGQALILVAMTMTLLVLFVGLAVDTGNLMGRRAKLQSAVDAASLSAAETLVGGSAITSTAVTKAYQILEANGIPSSTLTLRQVDFPATGQVHVKAIQRVDTFFMKLVPAFRQMDVSADAVADVNSYAEINFKPYGQPGVVNELNISVWGADSWRQGGDAYSPQYISGSTVNPWYNQQPYGYLYRIDVPASYAYNYVNVQIFDPDTYNRPDFPPTPYVPCSGTCTPTPTPTWTADMYASCSNPSSGPCTSNDARYNTGLKLNAFPSGRTAFWRADEFRNDHTAGGINPSNYADSMATNTQYTLWHFDPHITSAFGDPSTLTDQPTNGCGGCLARYTVGSNTLTDLSWYQPPGFNIKIRDGSDPSCNFGGGSCFARESNGGVYFYLYIQGIGGSSENNFDLRAGPAHSEVANNLDCSNLGGAAYSTACYVNRAYAQALPDWQTAGVNIFAKRAMPINLDTGTNFPMLFTQVSKNAAGQTLGIRHFDQDCTGGCGPSHTMNYQMQKCVLTGSTYAPCQPTSSDSCFGNFSSGGLGYVGPDNDWYCTGCPQPETVQIPLEGTADYTTFFGPNGECSTSWLRLQSDPSYSQDTTVWEMPFVKPRLVK